jgi:2-C-methyl-D-erythritol 4-phosphate cytidylyltransferase
LHEIFFQLSNIPILLVKHYVIIVAGGNGNRMKADVPKQFLILGDRPVLMQSLQRFYDADPSTEIIVALPENEIDTWNALCVQHSFTIPHRITKGGETRFHSVKKALEQVKEKSIVAVHDGVRPFADTNLINRCFSEAERYGNAVPAIPVNDSMRKVEDERNEWIDRNSFVIIQTPQCFASEMLKEAYNIEYKSVFTDDAAVVELHGQTIHLTEGERENIKITYPLDLIIGEAILKKKFSDK